MNKTRLEAFSDGVIAIIITIMVLELKIPHGSDLQSLRQLLPVFTSYTLSFVFLGIYWNNHHHLLHASQKVTASVLWANLHLLFWLSLIPFVTGWMGENSSESLPVATYGLVLLFSGIAFYVLSRVLLRAHGKSSTIALALGDDFKGKLSVALYIIAVPAAFIHVGLAYLLFGTVALMWLVPDRRIEKALKTNPMHNR